MKNKIIIFLVFGMFLINLASAGNLSLFCNPGPNSASTIIEYTFNFSSSNNCLPANIILSHNELVVINSRGFGHLEINLSGLSEVPQRLCEFKEGTYVLRKNHSFSDIIANNIYAQNLNISNNINASGNITARYFIGNGSTLTSVCLKDGSNCPAGMVDTQKDTSGIYLYNDSTLIYFNETQLNITIDDRASGTENATWNQSLASSLYVNLTGDIMSGNLNMSGNKLTNIGELIMAGITKSQNITPITTNLYSLGNSTNWFRKLFVGDIQSTNINTTNLNASDIQSDDIKSDRMNTSNLTIGGYNLSVDGGDLIIKLT